MNSEVLQERIQPREAHFLSCSPWQILEIQEECRSKGIISAEQFEKIVRIELPRCDVIADNRVFYYRNKMEYSFWEEESGLELASFRIQRILFAFSKSGVHRLQARAIALGDRVKSAVLVESDQESVKWAERNINVNHLDSFRAVFAPSERALNEICADRVIIVDPPRAGLHQKVIKQSLCWSDK